MASDLTFRSSIHFEFTIFNILRNYHTAFHSDSPILHSRNPCTKAPFINVLTNTCYFLFFCFLFCWVFLFLFLVA